MRFYIQATGYFFLIFVFGVSSMAAEKSSSDANAAAKAIVANSDIGNQIDYSVGYLYKKIEGMRKRPFCKSNPDCIKVLDDYMKKYKAQESQEREYLVKQFEKDLKNRFTEKQLIWLSTVYQAELYKRFQSYLYDDKSREWSMRWRTLETKMVEDVDKVTSPSRAKTPSSSKQENMSKKSPIPAKPKN